MCAPFMPTLPGRVNQQIPLFNDAEKLDWNDAGQWGLLASGVQAQRARPVSTCGSPKTLDEPQEPAPAAETEPAVSQEQELITIDEFARIDLRVGEVIAARKMKKADKLLVLKVRIGEEDGPSWRVSPSTYGGTGRQEDRGSSQSGAGQTAGVESQGMLLAASSQGWSEYPHPG